MGVRRWMAMAALTAAGTAAGAQQNPAIPAGQLVREVVYNELHDHEQHGYWRYWVVQRTGQETRRTVQVETADGPVARLVESNGHALDPESERKERARLDHLQGSASEQARLKQDHSDDEKRIGRIVALLPDAFLYEYAGEEQGRYRLHFRPNPKYPPRSIEARIFHAMSGDLWVDARMKRLARLDGKLEENVDFGFGILGRLYKGGWFQLERTPVSGLDWKTDRLEVHMNGRAMLFKTIARETSEVRGGFTPVPPGLNLGQGMALLEPQDAAIKTRPAAFTTQP